MGDKSGKYRPLENIGKVAFADLPDPHLSAPTASPSYPPQPQIQPQFLVGGQASPQSTQLCGDSQPPPAGWTVGSDGSVGTTTVHMSYMADDENEKINSFSEKNIRIAFIRKVYAILSVQLLITVGIIAMFIFEESVARFSYEHPEMMYISMVCTLILTLVLVCCSDCARQWPRNFILLITFTVFEGWMLGTLCSFFAIEDVLIAAGICAVVCFGLTIFAFQTKWDFTACGSVLFVSLCVLIIFGILAAISPGNILHTVYASLGALSFSFYLVYDTQMMLGGNHKFSISPEDYIFAALAIYLDVIQLFVRILLILGKRK